MFSGCSVSGSRMAGEAPLSLRPLASRWIGRFAPGGPSQPSRSPPPARTSTTLRSHARFRAALIASARSRTRCRPTTNLSASLSESSPRSPLCLRIIAPRTTATSTPTCSSRSSRVTRPASCATIRALSGVSSITSSEPTSSLVLRRQIPLASGNSCPSRSSRRYRLPRTFPRPSMKLWDPRFVPSTTSGTVGCVPGPFPSLI